MNKRLLLLEQRTSEGSKDAFVWYALALEYAGLDRAEDALRTFTSLRDLDPGYVPMYLMCGTMLIKSGRLEDARGWLEAGVAVARQKGDSHALSELEDALSGADSVRGG